MASELAKDHAARPFIVLKWYDAARHAALDEALSLASQNHLADPTSTWVVVQIVATVEGKVEQLVTHHRF